MPGSEAATAGSRCPDCDAEVVPPGRFCVRCGAGVAEPDGDGPGGRQPAPGDVPATGEVDPVVAPPPEPVGEQPRGPSAPHAEAAAVLPPPASGRGATVRCPSCGQVNDRARELCRSCGVDLDPADRTSVPVRPRRTPSRRGDRWQVWRRWWVVPIAMAVVAGGVTAGLAWMQVGPFARVQEPLELVPFPAERRTGPTAPLALVDIGTLTSAAPEGDRIFSPDRMVDQDPTTAWRGDGPTLTEGAPETIGVTLAQPAWLEALVVANGDHLDADAYAASGRIERLELWVDGDLHLDVRLLDLGPQRQVVTLPQPLLTTAVRLVVVDTVPGSLHPEPALSGLELLGQVAAAEDAALARSRAEQRPAGGAPPGG